MYMTCTWRARVQDGSYLAELLLAKGYIVHGIIRRSSSFNTQRIEHLYKDRHEKTARMSAQYTMAFVWLVAVIRMCVRMLRMHGGALAFACQACFYTTAT